MGRRQTITIPEDFVPLAQAHTFIGVRETDFWRGVDVAGVDEVLFHLRPYFRRADLERVRTAVDNLPATRPKSIYIVQIGKRGHFKIGIANDHARRIMELQVGCPRKLRVEHVEPGDHALERSIHRALAAHRAQGEWFSATPEVVAFVEHAKGSGLKEALRHVKACCTGKLAGKSGGKRRL